MALTTENSPLNIPLTLWHRTGTPLKVLLADLALIKLDNEVIECHLTLLANSQTYQRIDTEALFNLKPEIRIPLNPGKFLPSPDIEIKISLQPNLLPKEIEQASNAAVAANYLRNLSQNPRKPLLYEDNWLALSVRQQQQNSEISYRTIWANITPSAFSLAATSALSEQIFQATVNFANDWTQGNFAEMSQDSMARAVELLTQTLGKVSENIANTTEKTFAGPIAPQSNNQQILQNPLTQAVSYQTENQLIFPAIINFFHQDNWPFVLIEDETAIEIAFTGKNGTWNCYAQVIESENLFVFYSICPINAPESKRLAVAELIAKINFNILLGNFELDVSDGEIRYKTSIALEGDRISFSSFKNIVYTNVLMMDRYLPEIMSLLHSDGEQAPALTATESLPENLPPSDFNSPSATVTVANDSKDKLGDRPIQPPSQLDNSVNTSPLEADPESKQSKHLGELLYLLTPAELAEFEKIKQMKAAQQPLVVMTLIKKLEKQLIARLNTDGELVFAGVKNFYEQHKTALKSAELIRRYWELFELSKQLIEQAKNYEGSNFAAIKERKALGLVIEGISDSIKTSIEQLATNILDVKLNIDCLIEIEEIKEKLAYCQEKLKNQLLK